MTRRAASSAPRSRSSCPSASSRHSRCNRARRCCSPPANGATRRASSARFACTSEESSTSSTSRRSPSSGSPTSRCSSGTTTRAGTAPSTIPFTRPTDEWRERFADEPADALANAYDIIVNGNELGGGSFRIHEPELQAKVFDLLALTPDEQRAKFGFLLDALAMGAPPHGGIALGIDRMAMVLAAEPNLRDVIAFPKNQAGLDPMSGAPSEVTQEQLDELGIRLAPPPQPPRAATLGACATSWPSASSSSPRSPSSRRSLRWRSSRSVRRTGTPQPSRARRHRQAGTSRSPARAARRGTRSAPPAGRC